MHWCAKGVVYDSYVVWGSRVLVGEYPSKDGSSNVDITWVIFKNEFLEKYFLANVCSRKEIDFLLLKQWSMIMVDYATNFEEILRFFPHYNGVEAKGSKCVKFRMAYVLRSSSSLIIRRSIGSQCYEQVQDLWWR